MKKVTIAAAVAAALLFTVATALATIPAVSLLNFALGHHGDLLPLW